MFWSIDRFEGDYAVCEDENGHMHSIARKLLPETAEEGDVLRMEGGTYAVDREETERRRQEVIRLQDSLWD
ncbi:MAG: DUF3006 domain-containing protein [Clostridiales bacterium]|nr:DUF3006 domain-containing protein [Clostridiales bacterium]